MLQKDEIKVPMIFMGTSLFAANILDSLISDKYNIIAVFTQPDKKVGRSQKLQESPVKELAVSNNLQVFQPEKFDEPIIQGIAKLHPDIIVVAAYGKILPKKVLNIPGLGCVNVHASLLPRWQGPSPIQNTLLEGDTESGVTLMLMNEGVDTGDIIEQKKIMVEAEDNTATLSEKLASLAVDLVHESLPLWIKRKIESKPQDQENATLCQLIEREDGHIIWIDSAQSIWNRYRALSPWPGIFSFWELDNSIRRIKLLKISLGTEDIPNQYHLGEVFDFGGKACVKAAEGYIIIESLQLEGKTEVVAQEFVNGYPQFIGSILR